MPKITILSSVPENMFSSVINRDGFGFTQDEITSARQPEERVFRSAMGIPDIQKNTVIEVVRTMNGIPRNHSSDMYILGGSPAMVTDRDKDEWIDRLISFVGAKIEKGVPIFGICFGHQVIAAAMGGRIDWMDKRIIGPRSIMLDGREFDSLWSHKQGVMDAGEAQVIASGGEVASPIEMMKVEDHVVSVQFHPEFSPDFMSFLTKLMSDQLRSEGISPEEIISRTQCMKNGNSANLLLREFLQKYYHF